jgi:hypothetical protein
MATIYKTITYSEKENRNTRSLTSAELTQVSTILNNFKTYFISKHL